MKRISFAALMLVALAGTSFAQITYDGRLSETVLADFRTAVGATGVVDFNELPQSPGAFQVLGRIYYPSGTQHSFTLTNGFGTLTFSPLTETAFDCEYSGCYSLRAPANGPGSATITFSQAHTAFGAFFTGLSHRPGEQERFGGYIGLTFFNGDTNVGTWDTIFDEYDFAFFGVSDLPSFTSVSLDISDGNFYMIDDIEVGGTAAPEPASFVLLATGLLGVFGIARRRNA